MGELFLKVERGPNILTKEDKFQELLFSGHHCFPLSPKDEFEYDQNGLPETDFHILEMVLDHLGSPSDIDMSFITDNQAMNYIKKFKKRY